MTERFGSQQESVLEAPGTRELQRKAQLERVARLTQLGELAAGLAHEINQPLAAIIYTLSGSIRRARDGNLNVEQTREALERALSHAHRAADIVSRVRGQANPHTTQHTAIDLNTLVREMTELALPTATVAGVSLRTTSDAQLPLLSGDKVQIEQVLINLLSNAIDATLRSARAEREVRVSTAAPEDGMVELIVEDSGDGIDPAIRGRIFEPFYTTKEDGMGLGLSICQTIVESHGGQIQVGDRPQGGTRLIVTLPVAGRRA